jgi:putative permease
MNIVRSWFKRWTENPETVVLVLILTFGMGIILFFGNMLTPVLAALVIAYLLEGMVQSLERFKLSRLVSVFIVFIGFIFAVVYLSIWILPILSSQIIQLVREFPIIINQGQELVLWLPERYPNVISPEIVNDLITSVRSGLGQFSQTVVSYAGQQVINVINIVVYAILVPILIFFFLKDKDILFKWVLDLLPNDRDLADSVALEINEQIANYVRGKSWEILIVWIVSYVTFSIFQLDYALLLSLIVGLSVIIPYIGATAVTIPVLLVAYIQWGISSEFWWIAGTYLVIQILDGNVLVPILFSEVMNLHPIAIILALLMFGGIWGFWGVFFAIPLATVVHAVQRAWPKN